MPIAYILINSELGSENAILDDLHQISEVKEAYGVYGSYDLIAKAEADTVECLNKAITLKIRNIRGVKASLTLMKIEGQGER